MLRETKALAGAAARPEAASHAPRPHICFVAPHAWPVLSRDASIQVVGGAEVQMSILARLFAAGGYRVSMICLDFGQEDRARIDDVVVHKLFRMEQGIPVVRFLHPRLTTMWRRLKEVDADIYYYRSAAMWLGVLAEFCRRHGKRSIYAGASDKDFVPGQGGQIRYARDRWLYRRGLARVDAIVAQNAAQRADCKRHYNRDAVVIPSCYELPEKSASQEKNLVLWVGTIHAGKRPELLLDLAERLPRQRFVMIGGPGSFDRAFFERIRARAAALPNVEFTGFLPLAQVEPWFDRARVLVNTSVYEGMPNVFLQAWARGVPTVATVDVGMPAHRVASDVGGLSREVRLLTENRPLWESASKACRKYFERNHSSSQVLARYGRLFASLCPPDKGGSERSERGVSGTENQTPRSPSARDPLVRGSAKAEPAHDPLVRGSEAKP
jgi:glycosyltransferase involved in cell wall biosynthesis